MIINDSNIKESFLSPGEFPVSVTQPLLYENYLVKKNPGASALSHSEQYVNYPIFPATSCGTNNLRYWRLPTDGQCSRADMCGGLYKKTEPNITITTTAAPAPMIGSLEFDFVFNVLF